MKISVLTDKGAEVREINLELSSGKSLAHGVITQALLVSRNNQRRFSALTKTRGDVRGGGRKPWRQKGTGRARQGSTRSPLWRGGGVAHGPSGQGRSLKTNQKASRSALLSVLISRIGQGQVLVLSDQLPVFSKSKQLVSVLSALKIAGLRSLLVSDREDLVRSSRNLKNVNLVPPASLSLPHLLGGDKIIFLESDFMRLLKRVGL